MLRIAPLRLPGALTLSLLRRGAAKLAPQQVGQAGDPQGVQAQEDTSDLLDWPWVNIGWYMEPGTLTVML